MNRLWSVRVGDDKKKSLAFGQPAASMWVVLHERGFNLVSREQVSEAEQMWACSAEVMGKPVYDPKTHKVVPKDAVVIEGVTEPQLLRLFNLAVLHVPLDKFEDDWKLLGALAKTLNDKLIAERDAQLTPSATTETEGGGKREEVGMPSHFRHGLSMPNLQANPNRDD